MGSPTSWAKMQLIALDQIAQIKDPEKRAAAFRAWHQANREKNGGKKEKVH